METAVRPGHKRHGSADIGALAELPEILLDALGNDEIANAPPERWAFLDTETTGLAGGSGTYAFLIGVGRITAEGFRVRQFFMREYAEEHSAAGRCSIPLEPVRRTDYVQRQNLRSAAARNALPDDAP